MNLEKASILVMTPKAQAAREKHRSMNFIKTYCALKKFQSEQTILGMGEKYLQITCLIRDFYQ